MIKQREILTAINRMLVEIFPTYAVYVLDCPKDFARPSFLLEYVRTTPRDADRHTLEKTVYLTITCFTPVDKHYRTDPDQLADLQDGVMELFSPGYIKVGNRALKVQSSSGGMDTDRAYIDLQLEFFDDRTVSEEELPLMGTVHTNIKEG